MSAEIGPLGRPVATSAVGSVPSVSVTVSPPWPVRGTTLVVAQRPDAVVGRPVSASLVFGVVVVGATGVVIGGVVAGTVVRGVEVVVVVDAGAVVVTLSLIHI